MPTSTITTVGGYVALGAVGAAAYYVVKKGQKKNLASPVAAEPEPVPASKPKAKKRRNKAFKEAAAANESATSTAVDVAPSGSTGTTKDEISDAEFVRQMAGLKDGTPVAAASTSSKNKKKKKSKAAKKAAAAQESDSPEENTAPSTSTGRDVEESPATSPEVKAVDSTGVADMLPAAPSGPSVLRLTDTDAVKTKPKAKKEEAPVETKKQRQNRKKAEAAKAANAEAERERQVLLEKQRRTARIAEGRPAKDGSAPATSAWTAAPAAAAPVELLDTAAPAPKAAAPKAAAVPFTEEEQIAQASADSAEWNTVTKKRSTKKAAPVEETVSEVKSDNVAPAAAKASKTSKASKAAASTPSESESEPEESYAGANYGGFSALAGLPARDNRRWDV